MNLEEKEAEKYRRMWSNRNYASYSPGAELVGKFINVIKPRKRATIIDFGCGSGKASLLLAVFGLKVIAIDFAENCLDEDIKEIIDNGHQPIKFVKANLWNIPANVMGHYGYCTDVLEHIPTEKIDLTLENILKCAKSVFFQISLVDDEFGKTIGEPLHLTVKPFDWWLNKFKEIGTVLFAHDAGTSAIFYVNGWINAKELIGKGTVNTEFDTLIEHVKINTARNLTQVAPHDAQDKTVMLLGGGPSLANFEEEIIRKRKAGQILITTNGTYNWALERGINPSAQIIVDAREFNKRFVNPPISGCKYLISSQCHPAVFDSLKGFESQISIWHSALSDKISEVLDEIYDKKWYPVPGGSTVMLRALPLLRMLGFKKFEIYGFDSCLIDEQHHAYEQKENDYKGVLNVTCGDRVFKCHAWMASQAQEFLDLMQKLADEIQLEIFGDGLIAHIIRTGAEPDSVED